MSDPTGTAKELNSFEKFEHFYPAFETHFGRISFIIGRQADIMEQWLDAAKMYPINSIEFKVILERLRSETKALFEDAGDVIDDLREDMQNLSDVFATFEKEMKENVSRPSIIDTIFGTKNNG